MVDVGFVLALSFHHGDFEPDCGGVWMGGEGGAYVNIEILCCDDSKNGTIGDQPPLFCVPLITY